MNKRSIKPESHLFQVFRRPMENPTMGLIALFHLDI